MNEIKETASAYTKGAVIGGVALAIFALITRRNVIFWSTLGVIGGGFVAHKVRENKSKAAVSATSNFKNYDKESK